MKQRGFTLIELLTVVAIIGLLSTVVLTSIGGGRIKARDARRLNDMNEIKKALELYYADNYQYPPMSGGAYTSTSNCGLRWCDLETALEPYIPVLPRDPLGDQADYRYYYDSDSGDSYQTYGLMARLEHPDNYTKAENDNGWPTYGTNGQYYEVGEQPPYCAYTGVSDLWWSSGSTVCSSRN